MPHDDCCRSDGTDRLSSDTELLTRTPYVSRP